MEMAAKIRKAKAKMVAIKKPKLTEMDKLAESLESSRCRRYASAPLHMFEHFPPADKQYPEVAFAGRANVGKSSLLNQISQFGTLARVSPKAGQTREVAWHRNRKVKMDVLDMPGYG